MSRVAHIQISASPGQLVLGSRQAGQWEETTGYYCFYYCYYYCCCFYVLLLLFLFNNNIIVFQVLNSLTDAQYRDVIIVLTSMPRLHIETAFEGTVARGWISIELLSLLGISPLGARSAVPVTEIGNYLRSPLAENVRELYRKLWSPPPCHLADNSISVITVISIDCSSRRRWRARDHRGMLRHPQGTVAEIGLSIFLQTFKRKISWWFLRFVRLSISESFCWKSASMQYCSVAWMSQVRITYNYRWNWRVSRCSTRLLQMTTSWWSRVMRWV